MTDYVVEAGTLKFTAYFSDGSECYVEMPAPKDPQAVVNNYVSNRELKLSNDD